MKKLVLAAMLLFAGTTMAMAQAQTLPQVKFNETEHQFGEIPRGTPVSTVFTFINQSNAPLVIATATASCGCTVPEYSKDAIAPNAQGELKVTYNAAAVGNFAKTITVKFEGDTAPVVLTIKGRVTQQQQQQN